MIKHYVGARYVPKFASPLEWAADTSYEALTIVTFNNASYTSKVPVPPTVGDPADNPDYWALTGNYNAQVEQYRQETETVSNNLTTEITNRKNADTTLQGNINSEASTRAAADSNLQSQINQIVAPSGEAPSAAEVQNARIGANGVTYDTLGTAIRSQVGELKGDLVELSKSVDASAQAAAKSASDADTSAQAAAKSASDADASAQAAAKSASDADTSAQAAAKSASDADASASAAAKSASDADASASAAAKSASDADASASAAAKSASDADASADKSEQNKTQAQEYAQNAYNSAVGAESAKDDAEDARDEIRSMRAEAVTLSPGSDATASYSDGLLSLGIPRGDKGDKGDTGEQGPKGDKGDPGEVTQAEFDEALAKKSPTIYEEIESVPLATFADGAEDMSLKDLKVAIEPVQEGTGDPSPDNVRPISGWTGAKVTRTGKNLLNLIESEMISSGWNRTFPISVKEGTYILSCQNNLGVGTTFGARVAFIGDSDTIIKGLSKGYNFGDNDRVGIATTITAEEAKRIKRIQFEFRANGASYSDISRGNLQLELGSTATAYEPYQGETYDIAFPSEAGTVYGGTLDVTNGVLTVDRAMWTGNTSDMSNNEDYPGWRNAGIKEIVGEGLNKGLYSAISNVSPAITSGNWAIGVNTKEFQGTGALLLSKDYFNKNQTEWKALALDVQVVLPLATPVTYQLTPQEITTLLGQNNIWADTGDVSVTYRADTKLYVDKKFTELQALILEN